MISPIFSKNPMLFFNGSLISPRWPIFHYHWLLTIWEEPCHSQLVVMCILPSSLLLPLSVFFFAIVHLLFLCCRHRHSMLFVVAFPMLLLLLLLVYLSSVIFFLDTFFVSSLPYIYHTHTSLFYWHWMRGIIIIQLIVGFFLPPTITDADASVGWRVQNCRVICKNVVAAPMFIAQDREVIMGCVLKLIWHKKINHSAGCDRRSIKADVTSCTYPWYHLPRKS